MPDQLEPIPEGKGSLLAVLIGVGSSLGAVIAIVVRVLRNLGSGQSPSANDGASKDQIGLEELKFLFEEHRRRNEDTKAQLLDLKANFTAMETEHKNCITRANAQERQIESQGKDLAATKDAIAAMRTANEQQAMKIAAYESELNVLREENKQLRTRVAELEKAKTP